MTYDHKKKVFIGIWHKQPGKEAPPATLILYCLDATQNKPVKSLKFPIILLVLYPSAYIKMATSMQQYFILPQAFCLGSANECFIYRY